MRHAAKFTQARTSASPGSPHTYTHAPASVWTCRPHNVHRHLLCPFPDERWCYQNVEPKCVWAVISNSIWGKRQISCSPYPMCCLLTAVAVPSTQNMGNRDLLGHPSNALSPANYCAHYPLLFKHFHHFFPKLSHMFIYFTVGKLSLFSTSHQVLGFCPTRRPWCTLILLPYCHIF